MRWLVPVEGAKVLQYRCKVAVGGILQNIQWSEWYEVKTAEAESRRMAALAANSGSSIKFMEAQAMLNISEGIKNGKVQTIVVPSNFTALMMNK